MRLIVCFLGLEEISLNGRLRFERFGFSFMGREFSFNSINKRFNAFSRFGEYFLDLLANMLVGVNVKLGHFFNNLFDPTAEDSKVKEFTFHLFLEFMELLNWNELPVVHGSFRG